MMVSSWVGTLIAFVPLIATMIWAVWVVVLLRDIRAEVRALRQSNARAGGGDLTVE